MKYLFGTAVLAILLVIAVRVSGPATQAAPPAVPMAARVAPTPIQPTQVRVVDVQVVITAMRSKAFLITTEAEAQATITMVREGRLLGFIGGERVQLAAVGTVKAGVDLAQVKRANVTVEGQAITIRLPAPTIDSVSLDEERTFVADHQLSWFSQSDPALAETARRQAVEEIRRSACAGGLVERTERDVQAAVTALAGALQNVESVEVVVESSAMCERE